MVGDIVLINRMGVVDQTPHRQLLEQIMLAWIIARERTHPAVICNAAMYQAAPVITGVWVLLPTLLLRMAVAALAPEHALRPPTIFAAAGVVALHPAILVRAVTAHALLLAEQAHKPAPRMFILPMQPMTLAQFYTAALITMVALVTAKKPCSTNAAAQLITVPALVHHIKIAIALLIQMAIITMAGIIVVAQKPALKELLLKHAIMESAL